MIYKCNAAPSQPGGAPACSLDYIHSIHPLQTGETIMAQTNRPTKGLVRLYMTQRRHAQCPPPLPDEIRRQLGWYLIAPTPGEKATAGG